MAILIKGMEMPTSCGKCKLFDTSHAIGLFSPLGWCRVNGKEIFRLSEKADFCPLVPVPPHGRLVDADEMYEEFVLEGQRSTRYKLGEAWELNGKEIRRAIYRLPTVIPASEDEIDEAQRDYQAAADYQQYCETYEQTYDPETGAM